MTGESELVVVIRNPQIRIEPVGDGSARRRVVVTYGVDVDVADVVVDHDFAEHITVHAVDEHDAPARPDPQPVAERSDTMTCQLGTTERRVEFVVHRTSLDVSQDWWSSGSGGEVQPIAEWLDHLAADITLSSSGICVAQATTPTVTGSWGALGETLD